MHRSLFIIPVVALVILSQLSSHADTFAVSVQDEHVPIRLKAVTFVPDADTTPAISSSLSIDTYPDGQRGYYLVQFAGPIQQAWKDQIVSLGAELMAYIPEYAFKVRMTPALADVIKRQPNVKWVGIFQPAYKLSPRLVRSRDARLYKVWLESGVDNNAEALAEISVSGAQVLRRDGRTMLVLADSTQIDSIARILDVAWIENFTFYDKHNEYGAGVIMGANVAYSFGYDGSGQTVAVADTGLGGGTPATAHVDIPASRITALQNFTLADAPGCYTVIGNGIQDADSGHGTHTAVSAVGDGRPSGRGRGTAPAANLVFQAVEEYLPKFGPN